jgi:hypothetical protein
MAYHKRPTSSYQPCDSYFVESYDDFPAPRIDAKEHAKLVARERQYAIADELSKLASDEFRDDILAHMLDMDVSDPDLWSAESIN